MNVVCAALLTIATMIRPSGRGITMTDFMKQVDVGHSLDVLWYEILCMYLLFARRLAVTLVMRIRRPGQGLVADHLELADRILHHQLIAHGECCLLCQTRLNLMDCLSLFLTSTVAFTVCNVAPARCPEYSPAFGLQSISTPPQAALSHGDNCPSTMTSIPLRTHSLEGLTGFS